jgi:hypothetical protein
VLSLGGLADVFTTYFQLSTPGKHFLWKAGGKLTSLDQSLTEDTLSDALKTRRLLKAFRVCDKMFNQQISKATCQALGRDRNMVYSRFIPYAWFVLILWRRLLEAFKVEYDQGALERCVLLAFFHREWNDLIDRGYSLNDLYQAVESPIDATGQFKIMQQLYRFRKKTAPPEQFPAFYGHIQDFYKHVDLQRTAEKAAENINKQALYVLLSYAYIMMAEVPDSLKTILKPFAKWFYMLDEFIDLESDQRINRITFMSLVGNPEEELQKQLAECRGVIRQNAPDPDNLIELMGAITAKVILAKKQGINLEETFTHDNKY